MEFLREFIQSRNYDIDSTYVDVFCSSFYQKKWIHLSNNIIQVLGITNHRMVTDTLMSDEYEEVIVDIENGEVKMDYFIDSKALKKLLLSVNTGIHDYYVKFEGAILDYMQYQSEQIQIKDHQLAIKEQELVKCLERLQLEDEHNKLLLPKPFVTKDQYVYIASTDSYAFNNHFKIGSTTHLNKRLRSYNVGRPRSDRYHYVWTKKCSNSPDLERYILSFLRKWKDSKNTEMVTLPLQNIVKLANHLYNSHEIAINIVNDFDKHNVDQIMSD